jgi:hypothetical protein
MKQFAAIGEPKEIGKLFLAIAHNVGTPGVRSNGKSMEAVTGNSG